MAVLVVTAAVLTAVPVVGPASAGPGDPATFERRLTAGSDDAEERTTGSVLVTSSDLELTLDGGGHQTVGIRVPGVDIPRGATITNAWLQFTVDNDTVDVTNLVIRAEAADNAATYTATNGSISARPLGAASVAWAPPAWPTKGEAGPAQQTPNLASLVQEVIDREGWLRNNPVNFIITGTGERVAESVEGSPAAAPLLHVDYTEPFDAFPSVVIEAPSDGSTFSDTDQISFEATATDQEDGNLSGLVQWSSDIDGSLGNGTPLVTGTLSVGQHVIEASVTDSSGQTDTESITVTVELENPPTIFEQRISAGNDDAEQRVSGSVGIASSDLELTFDAGGHQIVGTRFSSVSIPPGSTISAAWIQFTADETGSGATDLTIRGEAADASAPFTTLSGSIGSRLTTSASTSWVPAPWPQVGAAGADQRTPDLSSVLAEVINRPGWSQGSAVTFIITGTGQRVAESVDGNPSAAPLLHVEYFPTGNSAPTVTITNPSDDAVFSEGGTVNFAATASDPEDGNISSSTSWSSSRDGLLGTGATLGVSSLSVGIHTIQASVTDSGSQTAADSIRISVESNQPFLIGAGDIAECADDRDEATAELIEAFPSATVFTTGDNAYPDGTLEDYNECYEPSWGSFKSRTLPSVGNHDYFTPGAAGYFSYFGAAAGDPSEGWYSYDLGTWHVVVLNSNCSQVGGCGASSPQAQWLAADLAANPAQCTAAYWHHPQFSSGIPPNGSYDDFWSILHDAGADLVLNGHSHHYERFALQDATGQLDPAHGIRQFVIGTGGDSLSTPGTIDPNSEVQVFDTYGVLGLTLAPGSYTWEFMPVEGQTTTDSGTSSCVDASSAQTLETQVSAGSDDAEQRPNSSVLVGSSDLELTFDFGGSQTVGTRFAAVDIPTGSTITDAWIQFSVDETSSDPTNLTIRGEAADHAATYTSAAGSISSRPTTTASVNWVPVPWNTPNAEGPDQRTPNLSSVVQEIIDRPGWAQNNSVNFIFTGTGERVAESFEGDASEAPILHLEFVPPANAVPVVSITNPAHGATFTETDTISFQATATDAEDGNLAGSIQWSSDLDGPIGTGSPALSSLSAGVHVIEASVTDSVSQTASDSITVTVDPANPSMIFERRVAAGTDDAEQRPDNSVLVGSSDLELTFDFGGSQTVGTRFAATNIPAGATITSAWIQFSVEESAVDPTNLVFRAEAVDNAAGYTSASNSITSRPLTSASVAWAPNPWPTTGVAGPDQRTPDLSALIQEVVDRPGWVSGNALNIIISGTGERVAESFEGEPTEAPLLHIEYTV